MESKTQLILSQVNQVIRGKEDVVRHVLLAILAQGHVLLEDVPGVGKTTMANAFSKALGLSSKRIQFTSDTMPSDIVGFSVYDKEGKGLRYQPGAVMTNLLLADEMNRTSAKTQSALLEAMEEGAVTVDGQTRPLPQPFTVLATQNPLGSAGTQPLPNSQLDRFLLRLSMGYPDTDSQVEILRQRHDGNPLDRVQPVVSSQELLELIQQAQSVFVADSVYRYITQLAEASRSHPMVLLGISPRGALALCRGARARAFLEGRDYVIPQDVSGLLIPAWGHRLVLNAKARLREMTQDQVLEELLRQVPSPEHKSFRP